MGGGGECRIRKKKVKIRKWILEMKWVFYHEWANPIPNPSPKGEGSNWQYRPTPRNLYFLSSPR